MAVVLNKVTLTSWFAKEGKAVTPAMIRAKYELPESMALASRAIELGDLGYLKRVPQPANVKTSAGRMAAFWIITPKGIKFVEKNKAEIKTVEQVLADRATLDANGGRGSSKGNQGIALNKKANNAIDYMSQLIDDYNRAHALLKQIHSQIGHYLKNNEPEQSEG